jgi:hypothetical protein
VPDGSCGLGRLVAYAVDEDLEQCGSVGGRLLGPDRHGADGDNGAIDTHELRGEREE